MLRPQWFLGAPFDVLSLQQAAELVTEAVQKRERLVFATPNASFLKDAARNAEFRTDLLRADLSLADGMPIVWLGRLAGIAFPERVAGSDLLEMLDAQQRDTPLRVFFFGGVAGAAEAAMEAMNRRNRGLLAVGAHYPGFAGIDQMSDYATLDRINRTNADILAVSLGAKQGHRWIERNKEHLNVPVISHLGAVVNFVAGRLQRAPPMLQKMGLEWLWRVKEEPNLWRRYAEDSLFLARHLFTFPTRQMLSRRWIRHPSECVRIHQGGGNEVVVTIASSFCALHVAFIEQALARIGGLHTQVIEIRLQGVRHLDSDAIGWIYMHRYRNRDAARFQFTGDAVSRASLKRWRAAFLLDTQPLVGIRGA